MNVDRKPAGPGRLLWCVLAFLLALLAAAGLGYRQGQLLGPLGLNVQETNTLDQPQRRAKSSASAQAVPEAMTEGVPWPTWEFELRDPLPERTPGLTPPPWRLVGASLSGGQWQLIILREGQSEIEYFKVGDKLPGSYMITAISDTEVTFKQGRRELVLAYIVTP